MNTYRSIISIGLWLVSLGMSATESYCFRVYLKDKGDAGYKVERPEAYLSQAAIERRNKRGVPVTESDLPIAPAYLDTLMTVGGVPVAQSKWLATVVVASPDSLVADRLKELPMVDSVRWVGKRTALPPKKEEGGPLVLLGEPLHDEYGYAANQIRMLNGVRLHRAGFRGEGMRVAVIDAGFRNVDRISAFDSLRLLGTHNVVFPGETVFAGDDHGTKVLSCLAAYAPGCMVGTAPEASYLLIKSEESGSEYPVEEDYWTAAVEYADSVGVDAISSSLGYFSYDADEWSYRPSDLDGKTALISRAAHMAAEKGLLVFCSAGNEGNGTWQKITVPADASGILTVGAVGEDKKKAEFSSVGFTADNRVKPDVVALGGGSCVIDADGTVRYANGTSFSTPILAGLGTCLWQALPSLKNQDIITILQQASSHFKKPDPELGYGIPDVYKAYKKERKNELRNKK